jgi:hypothetical protein
LDYLSYLDEAERVITERTVSASDWESATGWHLDATGWCSGDRCIPVSAVTAGASHDPAHDSAQDPAHGSARFDTVRLAEACQRAVVIDDDTGTVAVGPAFGSVEDTRLGRPVPDVELVDRHGSAIRLSRIVSAAVARRRRLLIHAWAPW